MRVRRWQVELSVILIIRPVHINAAYLCWLKTSAVFEGFFGKAKWFGVTPSNQSFCNSVIAPTCPTSTLSSPLVHGLVFIKYPPHPPKHQWNMHLRTRWKERDVHNNIMDLIRHTAFTSSTKTVQTKLLTANESKLPLQQQGRKHPLNMEIHCCN